MLSWSHHQAKPISFDSTSTQPFLQEELGLHRHAYGDIDELFSIPKRE